MNISLQSVVQTVVFLLVVGAVFWLLYWLVNFVNPPEPFKKFVLVFLAVAGVLILIGLLLNFAGMPLVRMGP